MTTIINDLHLGARRQGGTTPQSQANLRVWQYEQFDRLLSMADDHLIINGDLFDGFSVDPSDVIMTFNALADWLKIPGNVLTLVAGNHDWNPRGAKTSSFHLLAHFLKAQFLSKVLVIDHEQGLTKVGGTWVIPHMANQDLFDLELEEVLQISRPGVLLLHANYNNTFAQHSDHSLNVSQDQVDLLLSVGWKLVFAHEHQHRVLRDGKVVIVGNQLPTSVADWIGCDEKVFLRVEGGDVTVVPFMEKQGQFIELDWRELGDYLVQADHPDDGHRFIRVTGSATADEAAAVVDAVAKFRQSTCALVVGNAVKIDGAAGFDQLAEMSLESITSFNVLDALLEELNEDEGRVIKELLDA